MQLLYLCKTTYNDILTHCSSQTFIVVPFEERHYTLVVLANLKIKG